MENSPANQFTSTRTMVK